MHGGNKEFGCDPSRSGQISARPPPIRSRNWGKIVEAGHLSRRRGPGHRSPSRLKDMVRLPAGMSSDAGGLGHPDHLIVEMTRVQGIAGRLTLANSSAISRVRRPNLKGLWQAPWRCHRSGSYFVWPIGGRRATRTSSAQRHQTRLGAEDIPENTRPGPAARWKGR
jgi:hypothetical protein